MHRTDGPAIIRPDGSKEWYFCGKKHNPKGPAITRPDGREEWYYFDTRHSHFGPAFISADGVKEWWLHGHHVTYNDYEKLLGIDIRNDPRRR